MCTRVLYGTGSGTFMTGRTMDWSDAHMQTDLWVFPRGLERDGGTGEGTARWTSRYGSIVIAVYNLATSDGLNEAGLAGNLLYLAESDFGDATLRGKPTISVGAWLQYMLDNYATVAETVAAMRDDPLTVVTAEAPNGRPATVHIALSDAGGDSAIFEFVGGALTIHHSADYRVMTNSPVYEQQLAINAYWDTIGGHHFLPGTINAADRFARASYNLKSTPAFDDRRTALAAIFSQMRAVSTPLGLSDPEKPNISSTLWRSVVDHEAGRYYFDSVANPSVIWADLDTMDLTPGAPVRMLRLQQPENTGGDVAGRLAPAEPFAFLVP